MKQESIAEFHRQLHRWYAANGRHDLPWRQTRDPYAIYLSEVMLQQTQVKTVLERYYFPFLDAFPTLSALAAAEEEAVLKRWQGLGYYNRAINLHHAAKACAPRLPQTYDALIALPGIGQNTAHAILAFAYHQPVAVLEANVKRVITRIAALPNPTPAQLWQSAAHLLDHAHPFNYNQAMMDLGATICTPKIPNCTACPAQQICKGQHTPLHFPKRQPKSAIPTRHRHIAVLRNPQTRFLMQRRSGKFLNGLYGFTEIPNTHTQLTYNRKRYAFGPEVLLGRLTQTYSHFKLDAEVFLLDVPHQTNSPDWHDIDTLSALPMSKADEKIVKLLKQKLITPSYK